MGRTLPALHPAHHLPTLPIRELDHVLDAFIPGPISNHSYQHLAAELARANAQISEIIRNCVVLRREYNAELSVMQLPPELLSEIFLWACDGDSSFPPLSLGAVCTNWRSVAWSTPRLWTSINLHLTSNRFKTQTYLLDEWLARGGTCPISIFFSSEFPLRDPDGECELPGDRAMSLLVAHSERWREVDLTIKLRQFPSLAQVSGRISRLARFSMETMDRFSVTDNLYMFEDAPRLQELCLRRTQCFFTDASFPWTQLQKLDLHGISVDQCLKTLRRAPNISFCRLQTVSASIPNGAGAAASEIISLPQLRTLDILDSHAPSIYIIMDKISAPNLTALSISPSRPSTFYPSNIIRFVLQSKCALERLSISTFYLSEADIISCVSVLPSVMTLDIALPTVSEAGDISDKFISLLGPFHQTCTPQSEPFLPNLRTFKYNGKISASARQLIDMLCSRWNCSYARDTLEGLQKSAARLESVIIKSPSSMKVPTEFKEILNALVAEGMNLSIELLGSRWI
ncbi:hypothetical protein BDQ12DRAFT_112644 [Crucibulum laeve]|uniref:F-box domain-containing protein n=1 Tax=Crucibulum laeve TaxID=68775 RepID=A0A5C3M101_9AGAR|nr:hypothetical protein BDQ12DRAFT_112644 [Crucibulum laeve]